MPRKLHLLLLFALTLLFAGCQGEDAELALKTDSSFLAAKGGSVFVSVSASSEWTLTVTYPAADQGWARVSPASGTGSKGDVFLHFEANASEDSRQVQLVLTSVSGKNSCSLLLTQNGKAGEGATVMGQYGYDAANGIDWLELPATVAGDGREVLVHSMAGGRYKDQGTDGTRNFSAYWDFDEHLSLWVAYPLNNALKGSGSRSDAWGFDPLLPSGIQPDLTGGSYGGGWTRGHQCPSADRLLSYAANASTYVPTNLTPQDYDFNCGIWAGLEGRVRDYASKADTLYVVTGCVLDGSTSRSGRNSGFYVKIPTYYYKALLYKGKSTYAKNTEGYMMAGFILPHSSSIAGDDYTAYRCSIDQLEERTGVDFFPNLEKKIGKQLSASLEAAQPNASFWN